MTPDPCSLLPAPCSCPAEGSREGRERAAPRGVATTHIDRAAYCFFVFVFVFVCVCVVAAALSGAFGGLLAYGLTHLNGSSGLAGWRWLFLVEGLISIVVGIMAIFLLPDHFEVAWWLREDEKALMRIRAEQTRVYQGESELFDKSEVKHFYFKK